MEKACQMEVGLSDIMTMAGTFLNHRMTGKFLTNQIQAYLEIILKAWP